MGCLTAVGKLALTASAFADGGASLGLEAELEGGSLLAEEGLSVAAEDAGTGAFLEGAQGGDGLGSLAGRSINASERGLAQVQEHLAQFGSHPPNDAMIARLSSALGNGEPVSGADASFYMHELTESNLMSGGMDYASAHAAALAKYGVSPFSVYAPEVIQKLPEFFNDSAELECICTRSALGFIRTAGPRRIARRRAHTPSQRECQAEQEYRHRSGCATRRGDVFRASWRNFRARTGCLSDDDCAL